MSFESCLTPLFELSAADWKGVMKSGAVCEVSPIKLLEKRQLTLTMKTEFVEIFR